MKANNALNIFEEFKGGDLKQKLNELKGSIVTNQSYPDLSNIYNSALVIKKLSAQVDEIVHATGIIQCLPRILNEGEIVTDLSLASGADGEGIDLVTSMRIAEFKFARWQDSKANGMRKRQVFADLVNLYLHPTSKSKELYVFNAAKIINFFSSNKATWKNVLSKSGGLDIKLEKHFNDAKITGQFLNDIYSISNVQVLDIDNILK
jgi:hypothetical protein